MTMDIQGTAQAGSQVILYEGVSDPEQRWYFTRNDDDGTYTISPSSNSQLVLAIDSGVTANNAKVKMQTRSYTTDANNNKIYADNQKWYLEPINASQFDFLYLFDSANYHNTISQGFSNAHRAIDFYDSTINGAPIYSPVSGTVVKTDIIETTGNYIVIETDTAWPGTGENVCIGFAHMQEIPMGHTTFYAHMLEICNQNNIDFVDDNDNWSSYVAENGYLKVEQIIFEPDYKQLLDEIKESAE